MRSRDATARASPAAPSAYHDDLWDGLERVSHAFFYERTLDSLLATFGLSVIIRQLVQLLYSANPRRMRDPIGGAITLAGFSPSNALFPVSIS